MSKNQKTAWIEDEIASLKKQGLFINIRTLESPVSGRIRINGKLVVNLASNNYLGLANHPRLKNAAKAAIDDYGVSSSAVRTIAGTTKLHNELETALAKFKKVQAVITLQSGYVANIATIPALVGEGDIIFSDELNHASIIDGCRLSKAETIRYKHLDVKDLEEKIKNSTYSRTSVDRQKSTHSTSSVSTQSKAEASKIKRLIVSDGVFSMDGDITPLPDLQQIAEKYQCFLMVDDAHGEGVLGKNGRGIVDHFGLHGKVDVEIGTMSKAFGVVGGYVAANELIIEWLKQRARPFLFSSAMTVPDTAASLEAVKILSSSDELVQKLWQNTNYLKNEVRKLGFDIGKSQTPIIPVMLGDAKLAQTFSKELYNQGVFAMSIGYPTVPQGKARIRVMASASHTAKDLNVAVGAFEKVGKTLGVI